MLEHSADPADAVQADSNAQLAGMSCFFNNSMISLFFCLYLCCFVFVFVTVLDFFVDVPTSPFLLQVVWILFLGLAVCVRLCGYLSQL